MSNEMSHHTTWFPKACRAARAWLAWKASDLASAVGLSLRQIQRIEAGQDTTEMTRRQIVDAFRSAGVEISARGLAVTDRGEPDGPAGSAGGMRGRP